MKLLAFAVLATSLAAAHADGHVHARGGHRQHLKRLSYDDDVQQLGRRETSAGRFTFYNTETGNAGSCGDFIKNSDWAVAMNTADYRQEDCGRKIKISYGGKTAVAVIKDLCPTCPPGGLDLSTGLFSFFESQDKGVITGAWSFDDGSDSAPAPAPASAPPSSSEPAPAPEPTSEAPPPPSSSPAAPAPEPTITSSEAPPPPPPPSSSVAPSPAATTTSSEAPPPPTTSSTQAPPPAPTTSLTEAPPPAPTTSSTPAPPPAPTSEAAPAPPPAESTAPVAAAAFAPAPSQDSTTVRRPKKICVPKKGPFRK